MFNNIAKKIKLLAKVFFLIVAIATAGLCAGIGMMIDYDLGFVFLLIGIPVGILTGWLGSIFVYAFGELLERVISIDEKIK